MTHKELVNIAYKWLLKNGSVGVVFKDLVAASCEIPDVIGFNSSESILIECKASRSDFFADQKKFHRCNTKGMGNWKFYCCPKGMIKPDELPPKWGLIWVDIEGRVRVELDCRSKNVNFGYPQEWMKKEYPGGWIRTVRAEENFFDCDADAERRIMYTALRRLMLRGYMKHIYTAKPKGPNKVNDVILFNE